jgi:type IV secretory pathway TrbD component
MRTDDPSDDVINPSLLDPVLIGGVERRVLGLEFFFVVAFISVKGLTPVTVLLAVLIIGPLHVAAMRMSQVDPRIFDTILRHLGWQGHYPPHGSHRSVHPPIRACIRGPR